MQSSPRDNVLLNQDENGSKEEKRNYGRAFIDEKLFKSRTLTLFGEVDEKLARNVTEHLLALAAESDDPITLYVSSPGGQEGAPLRAAQYPLSDSPAAGWFAGTRHGYPDPG